MEENMEVIHIHDDDFNFEENVLNRPNDLKPWLSYISSVNRRLLQQQSTSLDGSDRLSQKSLYILYERAIQSLPGSYKLWYSYLNLLTSRLSNIPPTHPVYERINQIFERSLYTMHKMPLIWRMFERFLIRQHKVTKVRAVFDRSLQSLPVTQHEMWVWKDYIQWVLKPEVPTETGVCVYKRYLKLFPSQIMKYIEYLLSREVYDEACYLLSERLNSSEENETSDSEIWKLLCKTISSHPHEVRESTKFNVDKTLREGWTEYGEVGPGWVCLAQYHAALGSFEKCRDIFEEGLKTVTTVRDFTVVFDAYSMFEGSIVEGLIRKSEAAGGKKGSKQKKMSDEDEEEGESSDEEDSDEEEEEEFFGVKEKIEFGMKRWEVLMDRRPELLNLVKLRRNPNDVHEWLHRVRLYLPKDSTSDEESEEGDEGDHAEKIVEIFTQALETIDPQQCTGRMVRIWVEFSHYYEEFHQDLGKARRVLEVGAQQGYPSMNDLALLHCERAELEVRHQNLDLAREYLRKVLFPAIPEDLREFYKGGHWRTLPPQKLIFRSVTLWTMLVDLMTSFGELEQARSVYEELIRLKVITIPLLLSYSTLLESHQFFSAACRVYEKGIHLFQSTEKKRNHVVHIWARYLSLVIKRYILGRNNQKRKRQQQPQKQNSSNSGVEHIRSLFDRCIRQIVDVGSPDLELKEEEQEEEETNSNNKLEDEDEGEGGKEEVEEVEKKKKKKKRVIPSYAKYFYLWYIDFEEKYGRIRNCLELFEKAVEKVRRDERLEMYRMYVRTVSRYHPISKVRVVYDRAVQSVGKEDLVDLVIEYVRMEVKLAEIDRARALFENAAKFVCEDDDSAYLLSQRRRDDDSDRGDPKDLFFKEWEEFENRFGNLDTFKLMYKVREKYHKKEE